MLQRLRPLPFSFLLSLGAGLVSLGLAIYLRDPAITHRKIWGGTLLSLWTLGPPIWFLGEFVATFPNGHPINADEMERLKHLQSLARNIWLAFLVSLAFIMDLPIKQLLPGD